LADEKPTGQRMTDKELVPSLDDFYITPSFCLLSVSMQHHVVGIGRHDCIGADIHSEDLAE